MEVFLFEREPLWKTWFKPLDQQIIEWISRRDGSRDGSKGLDINWATRRHLSKLWGGLYTSVSTNKSLRVLFLSVCEKKTT